MKTGPQKYPGASTTYWYQDNYGGSAMESNVGVIHTTEGRSLPSYGGGASAPNFTAVPDIPGKQLRWYQHFDFDVSSRALVNRAGGVQTNTLNAVQIELVGTCDPSTSEKWGGKNTSHIFWPEAPDWALRELAKFVKWSHEEHGIRLESPVTWKAYPSSYGATSVRLSGPQWSRYYGWLGHQHVPENDHGDPGNLPFSKVLAYAKDTPTAEPSPTRPVVDLSELVKAARSNPTMRGTPVTYSGTRIVEAALVDAGLLGKARLDGHFGSDTVAAYSRWQLVLYPGASTAPGGAADGIPGKDSLRRLGAKYGFDVKE